MYILIILNPHRMKGFSDFVHRPDSKALEDGPVIEVGSS
jgi:hypothetical protein